MKARLEGHVLQVEKPRVVDNPLDEGRHQKLVVAQIGDVFRDGNGNVGITGIVGDSLERDGSGGEHRRR